LETTDLRPPSEHVSLQVADFICFIGMARRTGRFPQLVDPRSSINGLFLTGSPRFRAESRRAYATLPAQAVVAADAQPLRSSTLGRSFRRATRRLISEFIATFGLTAAITRSVALALADDPMGPYLTLERKAHGCRRVL
jgi:hypothetical protein